jgi:hypothetical protein
VTKRNNIIKGKLLGTDEGKVELNQKILCVSRLSKGRICSILETAKSITFKLPGDGE